MRGGPTDDSPLELRNIDSQELCGLE